MAYQHWDFWGSLFPRTYPSDWEVPLCRTPGKTICETGSYILWFVRYLLWAYNGLSTVKRVRWLFPKWPVKLLGLRESLRSEVLVLPIGEIRLPLITMLISILDSAPWAFRRYRDKVAHSNGNCCFCLPHYGSLWLSNVLGFIKDERFMRSEEKADCLGIYRCDITAQLFNVCLSNSLALSGHRWYKMKYR